MPVPDVRQTSPAWNSTRTSVLQALLPQVFCKYLYLPCGCLVPRLAQVSVKKAEVEEEEAKPAVGTLSARRSRSPKKAPEPEPEVEEPKKKAGSGFFSFGTGKVGRVGGRWCWAGRCDVEAASCRLPDSALPTCCPCAAGFGGLSPWGWPSSIYCFWTCAKAPCAKCGIPTRTWAWQMPFEGRGKRPPHLPARAGDRHPLLVGVAAADPCCRTRTTCR